MQETFRTALAESIMAALPDIISEFEAALRSAGSPLIKRESTRTEILSHAREIVRKTAEEIGAGGPEVVSIGLARDIGAARAAAGIHANESLRASDLLFAAAVRHLSGRLDGHGATEQLALVSVTLHDVLAQTLRAAADSYISVLLNRVHQAQLEERRRISRELHDRIGHGVAVAQRDLELYEVYRVADPDRALARMQTAKRGLTGTMEAVRQAISDLRLVEPLESLEKAITLFLESSAGHDLVRHIEVNGDETWAPPATIEEVFLVIRESLRNILTHADAHEILVHIDISPDELWASVVDDGVGFDPAAGGSGGTGLLSMRERATLLGGTLQLTSVPGRGTQVELRVPLTGGA
jgi:signal transduction histidine kinase